MAAVLAARPVPAWRRVAYYALLAVLAVPFLAPLAIMVATSFKPPAEIFADPLSLVPDNPTFDNFTEAWGLLDFPRFIRNSVVITALTMLGTVASSSLVGYAFATLPGRGKEALFRVLLATMMIPTTVTLVPLFVLFSKVGWVDTYYPLIVPHFFANAFYVFMFRQFYRTIPRELFDAAEVDGANPFSAYLRIALPLSRPVLAAVAVFAFIGAWNDFLLPLIYLSTNSKFTLALGLAQFEGLFYNQLEYLMPMSLVALLPVLVLFFVAQRYLIDGLVVTGGVS